MEFTLVTCWTCDKPIIDTKTQSQLAIERSDSSWSARFCTVLCLRLALAEPLTWEFLTKGPGTVTVMASGTVLTGTKAT